MEPLATRTPTRKAKKNQSSAAEPSSANGNGSEKGGSSSSSELAFGEGLRRRRRDTSGREYDEVDDRITIPLASSKGAQALAAAGSSSGIAGIGHKIGVSVSTSASATGAAGVAVAADGSSQRTSESILQSGISKYRRLNGKTQSSPSPSSKASGGSSSSSSFAMTSTATSTTTTTTTAASTTSSPTIIIPGASLKVHMEDSQPHRSSFFPSAASRHHQPHHQQQQRHFQIPSSSSSSSSASPFTRQHSSLHPSGVLPDLNPLDHAVRLMNQKQFAAAIPFFTDALSATSASGSSSSMQTQSKIRIYFDRGNCFLSAQKYNHAIEDFTRVITMTPKNAQLFAKRAKAYAHLSQHHAALSDYNEAINISASSGAYSANRAELRNLYLSRAKVFAVMGNNVQSALDDLARAESTDGYRDAELYYQRASLHLKSNQKVLALKDFDRFLELHDELPHQEVDSVTVSARTGEGSNSEARQRMHDAVFERAKLLMELAADHAAEADAQQRHDADLLAIEQGDPLATRGGAAAGAGNNNGKGKHARRPTGYRSAEAIALVLRAIKDYTLLLEADPKSVEMLRWRGEAYRHIERYEDALKDFDLAHGLDPHDFEVSLARAKLYQQQNDLEKAIDEITTVLQVNGFFVDALFFRAGLFEQIGDVLKAQRDYTSIVEAHYDLRGESYSDAGNATNATEKTPLLSKASSNSNSSNAKSSAKSPQATVVKPAKITSEYSAQALVLRARLSVQIEKFDDAIADYERILLSFPNNLDAQLDLEVARAKKIEYEEKVHRDALAWLEQEAREKQPEGDGGAGGGAGAGAAKKKKKKKAKKKKRPAQTGYVLLEDDEDDDSAAVASASAGGGERANEDDNAKRKEGDSAAIEIVVVGGSEPDLEQPVQEESRKATTTPSPEPAPAVARVAAASASVTRDEACESMWEQSDDQTDSTEEVVESRRDRQRARGSKAAGDDTAKKQTAKADRQPTGTNPDAAAPIHQDDEEVGDERDEDKDGSTTDSNSAATAREVIVDEKYLRKRQRQLENLRSDFLQVCEARDKSGIEEVLERAERKQMTESLADEINRAKAVLEGLENGDGEETAAVVETVAAVTAELAPASAAAAVTAKPANSADKGKDLEVVAVPEGTAETPAAAVAAAVAAVTVATPQPKRSHRHSQTIVTQTDPGEAASTSKPPSLVIRPIAYGQALQLAEQSQNLFHQNQRLLQEKDAEIASLRQLLAQSRRQATIDRFDEATDDSLANRLASLRSRFPHKELREVENRVDVLVNWMGPSDDADLTRRKILAFVHHVLEAANFALGTPILVFPTGSFPMKTYLPTADLDVCLLLPKELEQSWYFPVMHALCLAGSSSNGVEGGGSLNGSPNPKLSATTAGSAAGAGAGMSAYASSSITTSNTVRNVNFINADVRVIKCTIDNISVDFTANRVGALGALLLLDSMDTRVGLEHLLKKSLILIKAWCIHESSAYTAAPHGSPSQPQTTGASASSPAGHSVLGASYGAFSTYAINTVVMGLFNQYGAKITHPLQALFLFLDRMAEFPWHEAAMTLHGPVALSALASSSSLSSAMKKKKSQQNGRGSEVHNAKISVDDVERIRLRVQDQFGGFEASSSGFKANMFPIRVCNIVDPLDEKNNLARSVSVDWFPSMKRAFRLGRNRLAQLLVSPSSSSGASKASTPVAQNLDEVDDFFVNSWRSYGRGDGWRPDLLVHPRQVWHGKAAAAAPSSEQDDDLRWQSLLPEFVPMSGPSLYPPQGAMYQQQQQQQYVAHHQHQSPHHHHHHHQQQQHLHMSNSALAGAPGVALSSESMPYQQHRRSFDSKSSPLKSTTSVRQQSSPGPAAGAAAAAAAASGMMYSSTGGGPYSHTKTSSARRAYDSPPYVSK